MQTASRKIGEFLVNRKVLSKDDLEYALRKEADSGVPLAKILSAEGLVSERDLVAAVADQLSIPVLGPDDDSGFTVGRGDDPGRTGHQTHGRGGGRRGGRPSGGHGQPARRRDDGCARPGDGLEAQALPGYPRRHCGGADSHLRPERRPHRGHHCRQSPKPPSST